MSNDISIPNKYSMMYTFHVQAEQINNIIKKFINKNSTITDATACVGGNSMLFCRDFKHVNLVEMDYSTALILKNNTKNNKNKTIYYADYNIIKYLLSQDIIFFDPPWGGKDYKRNNSIDLFLGSENIIEIIDSLYNYCRIICLKAPVNFNYVESKFWFSKVFPIYKFSRIIFNIIIYKKDAFGGTHEECEKSNGSQMEKRYYFKKSMGRNIEEEEKKFEKPWRTCPAENSHQEQRIKP
jgi:hypothetical protein